MSNPLLFIAWRCAPGALAPKMITRALGLGAMRWVEIFNVVAFLVSCGFILRFNLRTLSRLRSHREDIVEWRSQAVKGSNPGGSDATDGGVKLADNNSATAAGVLRETLRYVNRSVSSASSVGSSQVRAPRAVCS